MPHVFYATGHYRNGILLAPLTARLVADLRPAVARLDVLEYGLTPSATRRTFAACKLFAHATATWSTWPAARRRTGSPRRWPGRRRR